MKAYSLTMTQNRSPRISTICQLPKRSEIDISSLPAPLAGSLYTAFPLCLLPPSSTQVQAHLFIHVSPIRYALEASNLFLLIAEGETPISMFVVADFNTEGGLKLLKGALEFIVSFT